MNNLVVEILTNTFTYQEYFFWFLGTGALLNNLKPKEIKQVNDYVDNMVDLKNPLEAKYFLAEIMNDNFSEETKKAARNSTLIKKLDKLKINLINYYLENNREVIVNTNTPNYNCDIHSKIGYLYFQIIRLRMIIQPEIQLTINQHRQTQIKYIIVKGFWLNDDGNKERSFQRSMGREDEYPQGRNDPKAFMDGTIKIQEILYQEYLKCYPDK